MGAVVFTNIRVLDGTGKAPFAGHVRVQGNRIQEVLPIEAAPPGGPDADIVDGTGCTLMPGLTEAHATQALRISRACTRSAKFRPRSTR